MSLPDQDPVEILFDIALKMEAEERDSFQKLVEVGDVAKGLALKNRLELFRAFDGIMEEKEVLPEMLEKQGLSEKHKLVAEVLEPSTEPTGEGHAGFFENEVETDEALPKKIGEYRILKVIGEGGQGTVYLAWQNHPERKVALKLIHKVAYFWNREYHTRFSREYQALAMMNHHHIAGIYESGVTKEGFPFFTMEYIEGCSITHYCREKKLGIKARLALFVQVCDAVQHAHRKLVLHRDLKPGNILVTDQDGEPCAKIIDFGIAKGIDKPLNSDDFETQVDWMGTPEYLAPELLRGGKTHPDIRTDIYALGVLLYELVTDLKPYDPAILENLPRDEELRIYREETPPKPSQRLRLAGHTPPELLRVGGDDLDWIVLRAMEKEPDQRYSTVAQLHGDCDNYLADLPVSAKPPTLVYLVRKFVSRNKMLVTSATLVLGSLFFALLVTTFAKREAETSKKRFERSFQALESVLTAPHELGVNAKVSDLLQSAELDFGDYREDPELEAMILTVWGNTYSGLNLYEKAEDHLERSASILSDQFGADHPMTLRANYYLSRVLQRMDRYAEARLLLEQTYTRQKRQLGMAGETLESLAELAFVLYDQGKNVEANAFIRQVMPFLDTLPQDPALAKALVSLAVITQERSESEKLYRRALQIQRVLLGPEHPNTLAASANLANNLRKWHDYEASEDLYRKVIALRKEKLGPNNDRTLQALHGLALCLKDQKKYEEAETVIRAVWQTFAAKNKCHRYALSAMRSLSSILKLRAKYAEATQVVEQLIGLYKAGAVQNANDVFRAQQILGDLLVRQALYGEAVPILQEAYKGMLAGDDQVVPSTAAVLMTLGEAFEGLNNLHEAEKCYATSVDQLARFQASNLRLPYYRAMRANNLGKLKRFKQAEEILLASLKEAGEKSPYRGMILKILSLHYQTRGDEANAQKYRQ